MFCRIRNHYNVTQICTAPACISCSIYCDLFLLFYFSFLSALFSTHFWHLFVQWHMTSLYEFSCHLNCQHSRVCVCASRSHEMCCASVLVRCERLHSTRVAIWSGRYHMTRHSKSRMIFMLKYLCFINEFMAIYCAGNIIAFHWLNDDEKQIWKGNARGNGSIRWANLSRGQHVNEINQISILYSKYITYMRM